MGSDTTFPAFDGKELRVTGLKGNGTRNDRANALAAAAVPASETGDVEPTPAT